MFNQSKANAKRGFIYKTLSENIPFLTVTDYKELMITFKQTLDI